MPHPKRGEARAGSARASEARQQSNDLVLSIARQGDEGKSLTLASIPAGRRIQLREKPDPTVVAEYAERMEAGDKFPPVIVFESDDGYWLAAGNQRVAAAESIGATEIRADVRPGTKEDAVLFAAASNKAHGLRRTNKDKRRDAEAVLRLKPEWSDRRIAKHVGVGRSLVGDARRQLSNSDSSPAPAARVGADGKKRKLPEKSELEGGGHDDDKWAVELRRRQEQWDRLSEEEKEVLIDHEHEHFNDLDLALEVLTNLRGSGTGYPTLVNGFGSIMRATLEKTAAAELGAHARGKFWECEIPDDHWLAQYNDRTPAGAIAAIEVGNVEQAIALLYMNTSPDQRACIILQCCHRIAKDEGYRITPEWLGRYVQCPERLIKSQGWCNGACTCCAAKEGGDEPVGGTQ